jgi:hypothetical protein
VRWLDYRELWLISVPIYLIVMVLAMAIASRAEARAVRRPLAAAAVIPLVLLTTGLTISPDDRGVSASFDANGAMTLEGVGAGTGTVHIVATDMGNRVSPLPPNDRLVVDATMNAGGHTYDVTVRRPMIEDPTGRETTWWGAGLHVDYRGATGEDVSADLVGFGLGDVEVDGSPAAQGLPVEVVASHERGYGLRLEVGSDVSPIPGGSPSEVKAVWPAFSGTAPQGPSTARYIGGGVVLLAILALELLLNRREERRHSLPS